MATSSARALTTKPTPAISPSLIASISSILKTLKPHQNPNPQNPITPSSPLNQFSQTLTPNLVIQVIKSNPQIPHQVLSFFNWASNPNPNPKNYSHSTLCYAAMIDLLISHNLFTIAIDLLEKTGNLSDFMMGKLIKAYGDHGDIRGAIRWLDRAKNVEFGRCLYCYNALLGVLVRANRVNMAKGLFDQIVREGVVAPDVWTYTTMIRGFCKMGMIGDAMKVFDEMTCEPNLVTYNTIIAGLCRKGSMETARAVFDRMVERGESCLPDTVTFTTLIDGFCKRNELEAAERWMEEMAKHNCEPNVVTYNALINGLCLGGKVEEAKRMMTKMRLNGLKDNVATHTSLLKGFCVVGRSSDAAKHLDEMISLGLEPDVKAYGVVVNEYCKVVQPDEAMVLLEKMRMRGLNPHVSSYNALLRVLCYKGELDKAVFVLKSMPHWGCFPNFLSYSTVICSLCGVRGRMQDVESLVVCMHRGDHKLDTSTYCMMVRGYCKNGEVEMAVGTFDDMMEKGFTIDLDSFSVFAKELCAEGRTSDVKKAFEEIRRRCVISNLEDYKRIMDEHLCNL
ncbi:hypothetical protein Syun_026505 [Stephania yunnanensis]|uniref:Pentatricopeptide repeat-containing protein n=1 Tax=Stephania yunnanensis TaxID=152371 RepID=A0AAP0ETQ4_9MAGN